MTDLPPCPEDNGHAPNIETNVLAAIAELAAYLTQWEERWSPGDMGAALNVDPIEIVVGEVGSFGQVERGERHVGWIRKVDAALWEFVAAGEQLHWSNQQEAWVPLDDLRAENIAARGGDA